MVRWGKVVKLLIFLNILLAISVVFLFSACLVFISYGSEKTNELSSTYKSKPYLYLQYDPINHESSSGLVMFPQDLENGYKSFQSERNGNHFLITKFGNDGYRCTGKCFCESYSSRKSLAHVASRPVMYFLAAASSIVATKLARNHFDEECQTLLEDGCASSSISSEVEKCEDVAMLAVAGKKKAKAKEEEKVDPNARPQRKKWRPTYTCKGACFDLVLEDYPIMQDDIEKYLSKKQFKKMQSDANCQKIEVVHDVIMHDLNYKPSVLAFQGPEGLFMMEHLAPACVDAMQFEIAPGIFHPLCSPKVASRKIDDWVNKEKSMGFVPTNDYFTKHVNPTVQCIKKEDPFKDDEEVFDEVD